MICEPSPPRSDTELLACTSPGQRLLFTSLFVSGGGLEALTTAIECKDAPMRCMDQIIETPFRWDVDRCVSVYELQSKLFPAGMLCRRL